MYQPSPAELSAIRAYQDASRTYRDSLRVHEDYQKQRRLYDVAAAILVTRGARSDAPVTQDDIKEAFDIAEGFAREIVRRLGPEPELPEAPEPPHFPAPVPMPLRAR